MIRIETIETSSLGDRSYLATDGEIAVVVDPQRDIDRVLDLVAAFQVRVTHVVETHVHNDYVTGGLELAQRTGAAYVLPAGSDVEFDHVSAVDGAVFETGQLRPPIRGIGFLPKPFQASELMAALEHVTNSRT